MALSTPQNMYVHHYYWPTGSSAAEVESGGAYNFLRGISYETVSSTIFWADGLTFYVCYDWDQAGVAVIKYNPVDGTPLGITHIPIGTLGNSGGFELIVGQVTSTYFDVIWGGGDDSTVQWWGRRIYPNMDGSLTLGPLATTSLVVGAGGTGTGFGYMTSDVVAVSAFGHNPTGVRPGSLNLVTGAGTAGNKFTGPDLLPSVSFASGQYQLQAGSGGQAGPGQAATSAYAIKWLGGSDYDYAFRGPLYFTPTTVTAGPQFVDHTKIVGGTSLYYGPNSDWTIPMGEKFFPEQGGIPALTTIRNNYDNSGYAGYAGYAGYDASTRVYREHSPGPNPIPGQGWVPVPTSPTAFQIQPLNAERTFFMDWTEGYYYQTQATFRLFRVWGPGSPCPAPSFTETGTLVKPCPIYQPESYETEITRLTYMDSTGGIGGILDNRVYTVSENFDAIVSFELASEIDLRTELVCWPGYVTASKDRIWLDVYMETDPNHPNGLAVQGIRPLDDTDDWLLIFDAYSNSEQVLGQYYQGVTRWFGYHPVDNKLYHWSAWNEKALNVAYRRIQGRMYRIDMDTGERELAWMIQGNPGVSSVASDFRSWVPTLDGGLWTRDTDNGFYGRVPHCEIIRRYDISTGNYVEYPGTAGSRGLWPSTTDQDTVYYRTPDDRIRSVTTAGVITDHGDYDAIATEGEYPYMNLYNTAWTPDLKRVVGAFYHGGSWYEGLFDLAACAPPPRPNPGPPSGRSYRYR